MSTLLYVYLVQMVDSDPIFGVIWIKFELTPLYTVLGRTCEGPVQHNLHRSLVVNINRSVVLHRSQARNMHQGSRSYRSRVGNMYKTMALRRSPVTVVVPQ